MKMPTRIRLHSSFARRAFLNAAAASSAGALLAPAAFSQTEVLAQPGRRRDHPEQMSFLANDKIKVGIDLAKGGAITFLADLTRGPENMINSFDLGRQVQMSYYSGPVPFRVPGHEGPRQTWEQIGWNPIQVGDDFGNASRILEHRNDGHELYVRCVPMQWPLDDVPGECTFESWLRLEGNVVRARARLVMTRADTTQWPARDQELPAVYTNGPWYDLVTYRGDQPFTGGALSHLEHPFTMDAPWMNWPATEHWAALLDKSGHGLGVWSPETTLFSGGFYGEKGKGGQKDAPTGYIAPNRVEIIDHNITHDYSYALICGDVTAIRGWVYAQQRPARLPSWTFTQDRQGWTYVDATDSGWPIRGKLDIRPDQGKTTPQIVGPVTAWQARDGQRVTVRGRFTDVSQIRLFWRALDKAFATDPLAIATVHPVKGVQELSFDLHHCADYLGLITQLRLDPRTGGAAPLIELHSIALS